MAVTSRPKCAKRAYRSERAARAAHRSAGFRIRIYVCELCGLYHCANADKGAPKK